PKVPVRRMVFHEITRDAIEQALAETRDVDERLVDAQESRRILDRLYGYEGSPVLWKQVMRGLSAGRVQPVAARPVLQRERERKPYVRRPSAPFMTSTLQQEASRKLRYSAQTTMRLAQRLYENGYITYMRTDSTTLSESALTAAREQVASLFGADYVPPQPRRYERKVKNAQEAHEAI